MTILICPGVHSPQLTQSFLVQLDPYMGVRKAIVLPTSDCPPYSAPQVYDFLQQQDNSSVLFIAFSAGVVGAIGAAWRWTLQGKEVKAFIALDGWGVPLYGNFPIHRLSHDPFTHWSSQLLGAGEESFYADPGVEHLALWRSPQDAVGWRFTATGEKTPSTALDFLGMLTKRYEF